MRPAPAFSVFCSVLPLDNCGAVEALLVCVALEAIRVHCVCPTGRRLSLRVRCHLRYPDCRFRPPSGREAVLPRRTLHAFPISLPIHN